MKLPDDASTSTSEPGVVEHLAELRKQLIKSAIVFVIFFIAVFSTINLWLPYITRGHKLIVLGPLEIVSFYMSICTALSFGSVSLPLFMAICKPGLNERESRLLARYFDPIRHRLSIRLFHRQSTKP